MKHNKALIGISLFMIFIFLMLITYNEARRHIESAHSFPKNGQYGQVFKNNEVMPYINIDRVSPHNKQFKKFIAPYAENTTLYVISSDGNVIEKIKVKGLA